MKHENQHREDKTHGHKVVLLPEQQLPVEKRGGYKDDGVQNEMQTNFYVY